MKETIFTAPSTDVPTAGFTAKNNIVYKVKNPTFMDSRDVHRGFLSINEYNRANGIKSQVVNFGRIGGYLIPIR